MGVLECCRVILYLIEWIWTTVVMSIFPSQLIINVPVIPGNQQAACLFNLEVGLSRCHFGLAWGAIAFVVLSGVIIWYCLEYCSNIQLPGNVEAVIFAWLTIWWLIGSITLTATKSGSPDVPSSATVVVVFSWMLFIFSAVSTVIGGQGPKEVEYRHSETEQGDSAVYDHEE